MRRLRVHDQAPELDPELSGHVLLQPGQLDEVAVRLLAEIQAVRVDDELDRAAGALLGDLRRMTHANMSEEVDFFVRALDADLITPSDF